MDLEHPIFVMVMLLKGRRALSTSSRLFIVMQGKAKDHFWVETLFQNMEGQGGDKEEGDMGEDMKRMRRDLQAHRRG